jgi:hypothetical protein
LHVFLEEAQLFAPQRPGPDDARMLGAFEHIVRLGRNYGIGCTIVTQRPQSVNKEVLSQVECLCVLQVTGPHERKALEEWVQEVGGERKLVGELPGLARGEGYVWSPSWLRTYLRVRFAKKATFDASATPEVGKAARAASLSAVDVEALRVDLAEVVAAAEKDDPKALRRRVAELEREAYTAQQQAAKASYTPGPTKEKRVEIPVLKDAQVARLEKIVQRAEGIASRLTMQAAALRHEMARAARSGTQPPAAPRSAAPPPPVRRVPAPASAPRAALVRPAAGESEGELPPVALRMLENVARFHPRGVTRRQLATLSGYSAKSSSFRNVFSVLNARALVAKRGDEVTLSPTGEAVFGGALPPPMTPDEVQALWRQRLPPVAWKMLEVVLQRGRVARAELAEACSYSPTSSSFRNVFSVLNANELVDKEGDDVLPAEALTSAR